MDYIFADGFLAMRYTIPEEQIGPNVGGMKLEPTKAPYRVFRLISSTREEPHANCCDSRNAPAAVALDVSSAPLRDR